MRNFFLAAASTLISMRIFPLSSWKFATPPAAAKPSTSPTVSAPDVSRLEDGPEMPLLGRTYENNLTVSGLLDIRPSGDCESTAVNDLILHNFLQHLTEWILAENADGDRLTRSFKSSGWPLHELGEAIEIGRLHPVFVQRLALARVSERTLNRTTWVNLFSIPAPVAEQRLQPARRTHGTWSSH